MKNIIFSRLAKAIEAGDDNKALDHAGALCSVLDRMCNPSRSTLPLIKVIKNPSIAVKQLILTRLTEAIAQDNDTLALSHADALCAWLRADLLQESVSKHYELPTPTEDKKQEVPGTEY